MERIWKTKQNKTRLAWRASSIRVWATHFHPGIQLKQGWVDTRASVWASIEGRWFFSSPAELIKAGKNLAEDVCSCCEQLSSSWGAAGGKHLFKRTTVPPTPKQGREGKELGSRLEGRGLPWPWIGTGPRAEQERGEAPTLKSGSLGGDNRGVRDKLIPIAFGD